jgi:hypothetical protein
MRSKCVLVRTFLEEDCMLLSLVNLLKQRLPGIVRVPHLSMALRIAGFVARYEMDVL